MAVCSTHFPHPNLVQVLLADNLHHSLLEKGIMVHSSNSETLEYVWFCSRSYLHPHSTFSCSLKA